MALDLTFKPFSGAGIVTMYQLTNGVPGAGFDLGEVPAFDITQTAPVLEMNTSRSSERGVAFSMAQRKAANLKMTLKTLTDYTLGLLTSGSWTDVAAGGAAVTNWVAPMGLVVNNTIRLPVRNVSLVTIVDSTTATAKTLPTTNYTIDPIAGTVQITDLTTGGPFVQPFKVSYTPGAVSILGSFKAPTSDYLVLLNGTNAYDGSRVVLECFKFRFAPEGDSKWISDEYGEYTLNGSVLRDDSRQATSAGGQYYAVIKATS